MLAFLETPYWVGCVAAGGGVPMLGVVTIQRMDNVEIVVDDLDVAVAFFEELGVELEGGAPI